MDDRDSVEQKNEEKKSDSFINNAAGIEPDKEKKRITELGKTQKSFAVKEKLYLPAPTCDENLMSDNLLVHKDEVKKEKEETDISEAIAAGSQGYEKGLKGEETSESSTQKETKATQLHSVEEETKATQPHSTEKETKETQLHSAQEETKETQLYSAEEKTRETQPHSTEKETKETQLYSTQKETIRTQMPESSMEVKKVLTDAEVTDHTASLWKYEPVDPNEPEPHPEYAFRAYDFPNAEIIGAHVRGKKHKHEGTNCDDWHEVRRHDNWTILAVSDGAGSKKFSRIGAREACCAAVEYLKLRIPQIEDKFPSIAKDVAEDLSNKRFVELCSELANAVQCSFLAAINSIEKAFEERKGNPAYEKLLGRALDFKDFSATLLLAVIYPANIDGKAEQLVISCQVGDGCVAVINSKAEFDKSVKLLCNADSGDFSGETEFLTSESVNKIDELQKRTRISRSVIDTLMIMSDGVADDYFPNDREIRRLYFDLLINGILSDDIPAASSKPSLNPHTMHRIKKLPNPLSYPWVNDPRERIALHYCKRILNEMQISLKELSQDAELLQLAQMEVPDIRMKYADKSERLKVWLDNYVERGSFDDRTLIIARV